MARKTDPPKKMKWRDAAAFVLERVGEPMHYTEITDMILDWQLRRKNGKTPHVTLYSRLYDDIQYNADSPFEFLGKGFFALKEFPESVEM